jgi:hypothetical protein
MLGAMESDPLATLDAVLAGLHTLAEASEEIAEEALRNRITGAVVGLRAAVLTVRGEILQMHELLEQQAAERRQAAEDAPPARRERTTRMKYGCYQFDDTEGLFCVACYDKQSRRVRTIPTGGHSLVCPNCRAEYRYR